MESFRSVRVNALLKQVVSEYLHKRFTAEAVYITITRVQVTRDLKVADVYFSVFDPKEKKNAMQFLKKIRNVIQYAVGREVRLKYMPKLFFVWDAQLEKANHTFELLQEIDQELEEKDAREADNELA